jgi:hypothetical protein
MLESRHAAERMLFQMYREIHLVFGIVEIVVNVP